MNTVGSAHSGSRARGGQEETAPFPLEFMVARALRHDHQNETSPFPLDFMVIARKRRVSQDETAPFPLEYTVTRPEDELAEARLPRIERPRTEAVCRPKVRNLEASAELREYAARLATGEALPPYRGPILANETFTAPLPRSPQPPRSLGVAAVAKFALGLALMAAVLVAAAVGGDDAALRAAGASIGGWFNGNGGSLEHLPPPAPASPCNDTLRQQ